MTGRRARHGQESPAVQPRPRRRRSARSATVVAVGLWLALLAGPGCGPAAPTASVSLAPARLAQGPLVTAVWLPVGMTWVRLGAPDQELLLNLGVTHLEWTQRAAVDSTTAEAHTLAWCSWHGLRMPVYYEPPGFLPEDKLHDWARARPGPGFVEAVETRAASLRQHWEPWPAFWGYLVGHEDYGRDQVAGLAEVVRALRRQDPDRPAVVVGRWRDYQAPAAFLDALFAEGGEPNVFQHEHYVFAGTLPLQGAAVDRALDGLTAGYDQVAQALQGRHGRWHAIVQVHAETRNGRLAYRRPTAAEIRVQVGLALSRGAAGIVYFLYSSGAESIVDAGGRLIESRYYDGLVDSSGVPAEAYLAVCSINHDLAQCGPRLASLRYYGSFAAPGVPANPLLSRGDPDLEFGVFGTAEQATHVLVVNRRTAEARRASLGWLRSTAQDAVTGDDVPVAAGRISVELPPGGWRLLCTPPAGG